MTNQSPGRDGSEPFIRDRLTLLTYGMAITFGFAVAALGPAMPLLRDDLGISRTLGGLHFTALAAGAVLAGLIVEPLTRRWGRRRVFWSGSAGVATGALIIAAGWHPALTLPGALLAGGAGSAMLVSAQATLSDRHPTHRPVALTEINVAMAIGSVLPALLVGGLVAVGAGWRPALLAPLLGVSVLAWLWRTEVFPIPAGSSETASERALPVSFWLFVMAFLPSVGAEWSVGAWGADYLVDVAETSEGTAAFLMTSFFSAMVVGRLLGRKLAAVLRPFVLLLGTTAVGLAGILLLWSSTSVGLVVIGLLISGLGVSMQFPMLLSLLIGTVPDRPETAAARVSVAAGVSVISAPLTLGAVADQVGIRAAFGIVPGLFVLVAVLATLASRSSGVEP